MINYDDPPWSSLMSHNQLRQTRGKRNKKSFPVQGKWPDSIILYEAGKLIHINLKQGGKKEALFCHLCEDVRRLLTRRKTSALCFYRRPALLFRTRQSFVNAPMEWKRKWQEPKTDVSFTSRHVFLFSKSPANSFAFGLRPRGRMILKPPANPYAWLNTHQNTIIRVK